MFNTKNLENLDFRIILEEKLRKMLE